jgi:serine phosphatase RsbU (regulator of sigma subunit)
MEALQRYFGRPVPEMHMALLDEVTDWTGQAQQFDDITLMVIGRQKG